MKTINKVKTPKKDSEEVRRSRSEKMCEQIHTKLYLKKYNEFFLNDKEHTTISRFSFLNEKSVINDIPGMFPKKILNTFSPDRIDVAYFWKYIYEHFPLLSTTNNETMRNIEEAKVKNLTFASSIGALGELLNTIYNSVEEFKMLEIGAGYGNVYDYLKSNDILIVDNEYYNVELEKKFNHKNFFKTDGVGFPEELVKSDLKFDVVYCFNAIQHMSYIQKMSYYYGIYDKLKDGGKFIVGIHLETEKNKEFFGLFDEDGTKYVKFFNQFTPIDKYEKFFSDMEDVGFSDVKIISVCDVYFTLCITK